MFKGCILKKLTYMLRSEISYDWALIKAKGKAGKVICLPSCNASYLGVFGQLGYSLVRGQLPHNRIEMYLKNLMQMVSNGQRIAEIYFNSEPNLRNETKTFAFKKSNLRLYGFIVDDTYFCTHFAYKTDVKDLPKEMKIVQDIYDFGEWKRMQND